MDVNDDEGALVEAAAQSKRFPAAVELHCQTIQLMEWTRQHDEAVVQADSLIRTYPEHPCAQRTIALVLARESGRQREALAAVMKARQKSPWAPENLGVMSYTLRRAPDHGPAEAVALIDSAVDRGIRTPAVFEEQARALLAVRDLAAQGKAPVPRAVEAARAALRLDSTRVAAYTLLATGLERLGDRAGAVAARRRAADLAPLSIGVHEEYWYSVLRMADRTTDQKRSEILPGVERLLRERPDVPRVLYITASVYRELGLLAAYDSIGLRLVREYPNSRDGQSMFLERVSALRGDSTRAQKVRLLREFLSRPTRPSKYMLEVAQPMLFGLLLADSTTLTKDLVDAGKAVLALDWDRYEIAYRGAIVLADRGEALDLAERLAASIEDLWKAFWDASHASGMYLPEREAQTRLDALVWKYDALGWVHFRQGRVAEAEADLNKALEIKPGRPETLAHAGVLAEQLGRHKDAERLFVRGYVAERFTGTHLNEAPLRRIWERNRKSAKGFDEFVVALQEKERSERRNAVLATRSAKPRPMPAFRLATLKGDTAASADFVGRVLVVNFWGTWCGPCLKELPYLQEVYRRFSGQQGVAFLAINHGDPDIEQVRRFVATRKFEWPVLVGEGFATRTGVSAFPTTWFVTRDGVIAFETTTTPKVEDIAEEFAWRIEALLTQPPSATR